METLIEMATTIIYQAPSFAGLLYALVVASHHNKRLLTLVEKLCLQCPDVPTSAQESKNDAAPDTD